jgi:dynein heavy chain, axonemal
VEPKIARLRESEVELRAATREREAAETELAGVQAKLDEMQARLDAAVAQKQALEDDAAATRRKMDNAATLLAALGGEEARWVAQSSEIREATNRLAGDCILASRQVCGLFPRVC